MTITTSTPRLHVQQVVWVTYHHERASLSPRAKRLSLTLATYFDGKAEGGGGSVNPQDQRLRVWMACSEADLNAAREELASKSSIWKLVATESGYRYELKLAAVKYAAGIAVMEGAVSRSYDRLVSYRLKAVLRYSLLLSGRVRTDEEVLGCVQWVLDGKALLPNSEAFVQDFVRLSSNGGRSAFAPNSAVLQRIVAEYYEPVQYERNLENAILAAQWVYDLAGQEDMSSSWVSEYVATGWVLYGLYLPGEDNPDTDAPRYVGITDHFDRRANEHASGYLDHGDGNPAYRVAKDSLQAAGTRWHMVELDRFDTEREARAAERERIRATAQAHPGRLLNVEHLKDLAHLMHPLNAERHGGVPVAATEVISEPVPTAPAAEPVSVPVPVCAGEYDEFGLPVKRDGGVPFVFRSGNADEPLVRDIEW